MRSCFAAIQLPNRGDACNLPVGRCKLGVDPAGGNEFDSEVPIRPKQRLDRCSATHGFGGEVLEEPMSSSEGRFNFRRGGYTRPEGQTRFVGGGNDSFVEARSNRKLGTRIGRGQDLFR